MSDVGVGGLGMHQDVEAGAVQHQPWNYPGEFGGIEFHLVHRLRMRPDGLFAPSPHLDLEAALDRFAQARRGLARRIVIVDVRVIALDYRGIDRIRHRYDSATAY